MTTIKNLAETKEVQVSLLDGDGVTVESFRTFPGYLPDELECTEQAEAMPALVEIDDAEQYATLKKDARE